MNHHNHSEKKDTNHGCDTTHDAARSYLHRFFVVGLLLIPLVLTNQSAIDFLGLPPLALSPLIQFGIATVVFFFGIVFFEHALMEIKAREYGMMTLVSLAVLAGYSFSVVSTFVPTLDAQFYLEISTLIWVLLFGHYLEAKSGATAGNALEAVANLIPKKVRILQDGEEKLIPVEALRRGALVRLRAGERMPADGVVTEGAATMNESLLTGESEPVEKYPDDVVTAGAIVLERVLTAKVTKTGADSTVGQIKALIARAQETKPRAQKLADRAARALTFLALVSALLTLVVWSLVIGESFVFALTLAITVLVITCPHALGLAIPAVMSIATSLASNEGIFMKDLSKFEVLKDVDTVVFDKTGTLTTGSFEVDHCVSFSGRYDENEVVAIAGALEKNTSHVIGESITRYAKERSAEVPDVAHFKDIAGKGVRGEVEGQKFFLGSRGYMGEKGFLSKKVETKWDELSDFGNTVVMVADEESVIGFFVLRDTLRAGAKEAIERLRVLGVKVVMLSGDSRQTAGKVADELGIDTVHAEVLPGEKYIHIRELQEKGQRVVMVGDGINDAPALAQADVGVAIGAGTDIAAQAGDVILTQSSPLALFRLLVLSRRVYSKMVQNLWWALGYNVVAIPAAAGVFAVFGFIIRPEVGALLMAGSTVVVVLNALLLRRFSFHRI